MKVTIVALGKYRDIFDYFRKQLDTKVDPKIRKILVRDGYEIQDAAGWEIIQGMENFTMSGNHNLGWRAVEPDSDILSLNDDVYFLPLDVVCPLADRRDHISRLQELAYSNSKIGALTPRCKQGTSGNPLQVRPRLDVPVTFARTVTTACIYMKREMVDQVGYLDESFTEKYGAEDADYTHRINLAGWKIGIARDIHMKHGYGRTGASSTSIRAIRNIAAENRAGVERFRAKWGHFNVHGEAP